MPTKKKTTRTAAQKAKDKKTSRRIKHDALTSLLLETQMPIEEVADFINADTEYVEQRLIVVQHVLPKNARKAELKKLREQFAKAEKKGKRLAKKRLKEFYVWLSNTTSRQDDEPLKLVAKSKKDAEKIAQDSYTQGRFCVDSVSTPKEFKESRPWWYNMMRRRNARNDHEEE